MAMKIKVIEEIIFDLITSSIFGHSQLMEQINSLLKKVGIQINADRSYLFLSSPNRNVVFYTNEWCRPGIRPDIIDQPQFKVTDYPWISERLAQDKEVILNSLSELPKAAVFEKKNLKAQGVKSILLVPVKIKTDVIGLLGCECLHSREKWKNEDAEFLKIVACLIGGILERERLQDKELNNIFFAPGLVPDKERLAMLRPQTLAMEEDLEKFFSTYPKVHYKAGEIISRPGDVNYYINYGKKGLFRTYSITPKGEEITHNIFNPLTYLANYFFLTNQFNNYYTEVMMEEVTLQRCPKTDIASFLIRKPNYLFLLLNVFIGDYTEYSKSMEVLISGSARRRITTILTNLAKRFGTVEGKKNILNLKLTHRLLASLTGMTRETITNQLLSFQKEGLLDVRSGYITINNIDIFKKEIERAE